MPINVTEFGTEQMQRFMETIGNVSGPIYILGGTDNRMIGDFNVSCEYNTIKTDIFKKEKDVVVKKKFKNGGDGKTFFDGMVDQNPDNITCTVERLRYGSGFISKISTEKIMDVTMKRISSDPLKWEVSAGDACDIIKRHLGNRDGRTIHHETLIDLLCK